MFVLIGWFMMAIGLCGAAYAVSSARIAAAHVGNVRCRIAAELAPAVTILKPLHGAEPGLRENLESFFRQAYAGPVQIIFGVHDAKDAAIPIVHELKRAYPRHDVALVVDGRIHGENRKVSNLINMARSVAHEMVVLSDSDIRVSPDYLTEVVERLQRPDVGFVTCLYTGEDVGTLWSELAALGISAQFLPNVAVGVRLEMAEPCFGATVAFRRRVLAEIGGFEALSDQLADDYDLGRRIRAAGYSGEVAPTPVTHLCAERSFSELWRHEARWAHTIRMIDPMGFLGQGFTHATPWAMLGALALNFSPPSLAVLAVTVATRLYLVHRIELATGVKAKHLWLLPARDVLSFAIFLRASFGSTVTWRGRRFRVGPDGALTPAHPARVKEFSADASHPVSAGAFLRRLRRGRRFALPGQARDQIVLVPDLAGATRGFGREQPADRRPAA